MITIYHNPRCRKSRETLNLLSSRDDVTIKEYLKEPPSADELAEVIKMLGIRAIDLVRKGEAVYKELFKGKDLSEEEWLDAMRNHPKLIERPIVIHAGKAAIGRPPEKVLAIL